MERRAAPRCARFISRSDATTIRGPANETDDARLAAYGGRDRRRLHVLCIQTGHPVRRVRCGTVRSITGTTISTACLAVLLSCGGEPTTLPVSPPVTPPAPQEIPITGAAVPGMGSYDQVIPDLMRKYAIPGGAVAVVRDGKLIYARGFGYADVENKTPVQPDALFRIASVSKPITSAAIMKLVEEGKLAARRSRGAIDRAPHPCTGSDRRSAVGADHHSASAQPHRGLGS